MAGEILGCSLAENISQSKILVVGAGGIGCELLKNLALIGFPDISVIDGAKSPAIDFFGKTLFAQRIPDSTQRVSSRIGLVVFWQTSYIDDSCVRHTIYGQTHTGVVDDTSTPSALTQRQSMSPLLPTPHYELMGNAWKEQPIDPVLNNIKIKLLHPSVIEHNFQENRLCEIPVQLSIRNSCETEVSIVIKPKSSIETNIEENGEDATDSATIKSIVVTENLPQLKMEEDNQNFLAVHQWIGKTTRRLSLKPFSSQNLEFKAITLRAGLYNLNAFDIVPVGDKNLEINTPDDQAILHVVDTATRTMQKDLLAEILLLTL